MSLSLQLTHAFHHVDDARNKSKNAGDEDNEDERKEMKLQHHPGDSAHLANSCYFSGPTWFYPHFIGDEIVQDDGTDQNDGVARDNENGKPCRKSAVIGIDFAPVAYAQGDDAAEQQSLVRNRIENRTERAPLFVAPGDVTVESVADRRDQKNGNRRETLPLERIVTLDALAILNRHGDERRDHEDANDSDFIGSRHRLLL